MIGLHFRIEPDRFSTSILSLYTLSFRLASSLAFTSSSRFSSSRYSFLGVVLWIPLHSFLRKNQISFHGLSVLVLFSVSSLTNGWQHERICEPIANRLRPCLSTEARFANLHHLHRLLHWGIYQSDKYSYSHIGKFLTVGNKPVIKFVIETVKYFSGI